MNFFHLIKRDYDNLKFLILNLYREMFFECFFFGFRIVIYQKPDPPFTKVQSQQPLRSFKLLSLSKMISQFTQHYSNKRNVNRPSRVSRVTKASFPHYSNHIEKKSKSSWSVIISVIVIIAVVALITFGFVKIFQENQLQNSNVSKDMHIVPSKFLLKLQNTSERNC